MQNEIIVIGDLYADNGHKSENGRVYEVGGVMATLGASHFQQIKYILVRYDKNKGSK